MKPFGLPLETAPMEARSAEALPAEPGKWQFEPKWDGFRCLVFKEGERGRDSRQVGQAPGAIFP